MQKGCEEMICIFSQPFYIGYPISSFTGRWVSYTIGADGFSFYSIKESMMALVKDEVIEEILKYRKYKVWRKLDDNALLALEKRMGISSISAWAKSWGGAV